MTGLTEEQQAETPAKSQSWNDINFDNVPDTLKKTLRWICWKLEDGKRKTPKHPTGYNASSTKPSDWSDYETVRLAAKEQGIGIGFVLTGDGIFGIDIDDCRDPSTGETKLWALRIIQEINSYSEVSPSGTGVKIFLRGALPDKFRTKHARPDGNACVEFYSTGRYFAVTGQRLPDSPADIQDRNQELNRIYLDCCDWKPKAPARTESVSTPASYAPSFQSSGSDADTARAALSVIPNDATTDYDTWLTVGMALKSAGADLSDWESWSSQSEKHVPGECARKWASFKSGGVTVATLCKMADEVSPGWRPIVKRVEVPVTREEKLKGDIELAYLELNSGAKVEEVYTRIIQGYEAGKIAPIANVIEPFSLKMLDSRTFANTEYKISFLCQKILVAGQNCMVGGPSKCLKTSTILDLVISLGTGTPFLGHFIVPNAVPTGIISGESGLYTLQRNARVIAQKRGVNLEEALCFWGETLPQISKPTHLFALRQTINLHKLQACFIDPAYLCLLAGDTQGRSATSMFDMGPLLLDLGKVGQDAGCSMILIHHNKKTSADPYALPELGDMAFSGFEQWCRNWILLNRRERYEEGTGIHRLWLKAGGSIGHNDLFAVDINEGILDDDLNGRDWQVSIGSAADAHKAKTKAKSLAKEEAKSITLLINRDRVYQAYVARPEGDTATGFAESLGMSYNSFKKINDGMVAEDVVRNCQIMKGGRMQNGFRLSPTPTPRQSPTNSSLVGLSG